MLARAAALSGVQRLDFGPSLLGFELLHTRTSELEYPPAHREGKILRSALSFVGVNHRPRFLIGSSSFRPANRLPSFCDIFLLIV